MTKKGNYTKTPGMKKKKYNAPKTNKSINVNPIP